MLGILRNAALLLLSSTGILLAAELDGIGLPDSRVVDGVHLQLNGVALRTYSFLGIHIYVAGLYLERRSSDPREIIDSDSPKLLHFVFERNVDATKARNSWRSALDRNCSDSCRVSQDAIDRFLSKIPSFRQGDSSTFLFTPNGLDISVNDHPMGRIPDQDFQKLILTTFLGPSPTSPDVKRELLGTSR